MQAKEEKNVRLSQCRKTLNGTQRKQNEKNCGAENGWESYVAAVHLRNHFPLQVVRVFRICSAMYGARRILTLDGA